MCTSIKKTHHGKTKYLQGDFYSEKNDSTYPYRSSYELAYLEQLEVDDTVLKYLYEPFQIAYIDYYKKSRMYLPDFMILYGDGSVRITEIKPESMLGDYDVKAKAKAAREFIKDKYQDVDIEYQFVTEKDLFKNITDYGNFIKRAKKQYEQYK